MKPLYALFTSILLAVIGQILMKLGMLKIGELTLHRSNILIIGFKIFSSPTLIFALLFYGVSAFLWMVALSKIELSFAYPMITISYVLVAILSWIIFKESLTMLRIIALVVIIIGVFLLSRS